MWFHPKHDYVVRLVIPQQLLQLHADAHLMLMEHQGRAISTYTKQSGDY